MSHQLQPITQSSADFSVKLLRLIQDGGKNEGFMRRVVNGFWNFVSASRGATNVRAMDNVFFSPLSLFLALGMTSAGATRDTAKILSEVLFKNSDLDEVHKALHDILTSLTGAGSEASYKLFTANRLYSKTGFKVEQAFLDTLAKQYQSELRQVDFSENAEAARKEINRWVNEVTRGKIQTLVGPGSIKAATRLLLVNAVYFKGAWKDPFKDSETKPGTFYVTVTVKKQVPFMHQHHQFNYGENEEVQVLAMPYSGHQLSMYVFLPKDRFALPQVLQGLTGDKLLGWTQRVATSTVKTALPKFAVESTFNLHKQMSSMGLGIVFDRYRADFGNITQDSAERLYLNDVLHKAHIEVNEEGSEAAAATGLVMVETSLAGVGDQPVDFTADHPFLFAIWKHAQQVPLFLGVLGDPS